MERKKPTDFDQRALDLYNEFAHGHLSRRDFAQKLAVLTVGGITVEQMIESLSPNYAWAQQVSPDDLRIKHETVEYDSPKGAKKIKGLLARPNKDGKFPAVLVIHENRGLNPYIADVARRLGAIGFLAIAPDALSPLGGYPGNDDEGRAMQAKRNPDEMIEDFIAAATFLKGHPLSTGKVGAVGFCYGGGVVNQLMVRIPEIVIAGVPFYGRQPDPQDVPKIKGSLLIHYAENDTRINEGWPAYEQALKKANVGYQTHFYPATNHGFHNDSTPRYDEKAAKLAWDRTVEFFKMKLA